MSKLKCRYCALPSLPSMLPGHCRFHWNGKLWSGGKVCIRPEEFEAWTKALEAHSQIKLKRK